MDVICWSKFSFFSILALANKKKRMLYTNTTSLQAAEAAAPSIDKPRQALLFWLLLLPLLLRPWLMQARASLTSIINKRKLMRLPQVFACCPASLKPRAHTHTETGHSKLVIQQGIDKEGRQKERKRKNWLP